MFLELQMKAGLEGGGGVRACWPSSKFTPGKGTGSGLIDVLARMKDDNQNKERHIVHQQTEYGK